MCHDVNFLEPLVEKWKPKDIYNDDSRGIDFETSLPQDLKKWKAFKEKSANVLHDSQGIIPTHPTGFANSFSSFNGC